MEIKVLKSVLAENDKLAGEVRKLLRSKRASMFNFMSSPGSGKTKLLEKLIPTLQAKGHRLAVIEGDITTTRDAERLQHLNIPIVQIETEFFGGDCHLAANVVLGALREIGRQEVDIVLLENVGNLVCPAEFDTGSDVNIAMLSVTEGEDKPLKYPLMFRNSHVALINKVDAAQVLEADVGLIRQNMLKINPSLTIFETSGKSGQGVADLADWIAKKHADRLS
jgi:hydrogenase nickel incorporation protein HypB